jgi:hypothetical protein
MFTAHRLAVVIQPIIDRCDNLPHAGAAVVKHFVIGMMTLHRPVIPMARDCI